MIIICNIRQLQYINADEKWLIVRSLKNPIIGMTHVPALSPSTNLFFHYRKLANTGNWNKQTFQAEYLPIFLKEMHEQKACNYLNQLYVADKQRKVIALACFCTDETTCHRSIIAGLLQGAGVDVYRLNKMNKLEIITQYKEYYEQYKAI